MTTNERMLYMPVSFDPTVHEFREQTFHLKPSQYIYIEKTCPDDWADDIISAMKIKNVRPDDLLVLYIGDNVLKTGSRERDILAKDVIRSLVGDLRKRFMCKVIAVPADITITAETNKDSLKRMLQDIIKYLDE